MITRKKIEELLVDFLKTLALNTNADTSTPRYFQLSRILMHFLRVSDVHSGDPFPSEDILASCFNVSRTTANKAVQELVKAGWLGREPGRGSFILQVPSKVLTVLSERLEVVKPPTPAAQVRISEIRRAVTPADVETAEVLQLKRGEKVMQFRLLYTVNALPLLVLDSRLPQYRFSNLSDIPLSRGSLYVTLREKYGCSIHWGEWNVEAYEVLEDELADLLGVSPFSPILLLTGIGYDKQLEPTEIYKCYINQGIKIRGKANRRP